ncbi:alpha/beta fold hydrolase [Isoptericola croceus]|uniref:alpha/beta fold hydrolase n=1 Tax=Isoptericola croceus TaxID=3031406 RepID=UPI0023F66DEE|nr:alpha/beta fold hydrolase [Isoptericola croceus]
MSAPQRQKMSERLARMPGVRAVRRPATDESPELDLGYVRTGPPSSVPAVVIPGGPGLASVLPYRAFRRRAAKHGLDVLMVEHRGVGLSRADLAGADLPGSAMTIRSAVDDVAAVLDAEGVDRAVVYGSSYGSYLAQAFGAWHPDRVAGMVLDSTMTSAHDHVAVRAHARELLWDGGTAQTAPAARLLRGLVASGTVDRDEAGDVARIVYEFAGPETLHRLLAAKAQGRASRTWRWIARLGGREISDVMPFVMEFDLVARIAFRELNYAPEPDGGPFDPATAFRAVADRHEPFAGEPLDLPAHWAGFDWPLAVLSGERDLRTPRLLSESVVRTAPDGALVPLLGAGHSALDTHAQAATAAITAVREQAHHELGAEPDRLAALPRDGASRHMATILRAGLTVESLIPRRPRG